MSPTPRTSFDPNRSAGMEVAECSEKLQFLKASASASMAYSIVQFPVKWQSIKYKLQKLCSNFQPEILNVPGDDGSCNEHASPATRAPLLPRRPHPLPVPGCSPIGRRPHPTAPP
uniref:Uncharacterized protein n=1 Tax=Oryza nivara TaxID=4536 RepID=A0A0E0FUF9_ORYNI